MMILGIDPGKTTGLALIEIDDKKTPHIRWMGESKDTTGLDYKDKILLADVLVLEDWKTRPKKAGTGAFDWDPMITTRVIGSLTTLAQLFEKQLVLQQASIKPVGYGFANLKYVPGKKGQHVSDAAAHAMYYGVKNHLCSPVRPA